MIRQWRVGTSGPQYSVSSSNGKNKLPATLLAGAHRPLRPEDARLGHEGLEARRSLGLGFRLGAAPTLQQET